VEGDVRHDVLRSSSLLALDEDAHGVRRCGGDPRCFTDQLFLVQNFRTDGTQLVLPEPLNRAQVGVRKYGGDNRMYAVAVLVSAHHRSKCFLRHAD
jgi:hypothetical protein